jgi:hypothetical protein
VEAAIIDLLGLPSARALGSGRAICTARVNPPNNPVALSWQSTAVLAFAFSSRSVDALFTLRLLAVRQSDPPADALKGGWRSPPEDVG